MIAQLKTKTKTKSFHQTHMISSHPKKKMQKIEIST